MRVLKHEGYKAGQRIMAFDFPPTDDGRPNLYLAGVIQSVHREGTTDHPYAHYKVLVDEDTLRDGARELAVLAVPMEVMFSEHDRRIQLTPYQPAGALENLGGEA